MSEPNKQALSIASECFAVHLGKLKSVTCALYDESLRPFGITIAHIKTFSRYFR